MEWVLSKFRAYDSRVAICESGEEWSYADLCRGIEEKRALIEQSLPEPVVVAVPLDSLREGLAAMLAVGAGSKHTILPLALDLLPDERREQIAISGASWVFDGEKLQAVEPAASAPALLDALTSRGHAGLILFSSGSTGKAKGMLHDWDAFLERYQRVKGREDRIIQLLYPDHVAGLDAALRGLVSGSTLLVPGTRTPEAVGEAIERYRATVLPATPTFLNLMRLTEAISESDFSSLELIAYGSEPMPEAWLERLIEVFPDADFQQKFGTSETGAVRIKSRRKDCLEFKIMDADVDWKVVEGELYLRSSSRILGYINADNGSLEADGWYRTGDEVEVVEGDWLRIVGRREATINVGGYKVYPAEVEAVIGEMEALDWVEVFGEKAALVGMRVACRIESRESQDEREWKRRIRQYCRGRLANWKIPSVVYLQSTSKPNRRLKR